MRSVVLDVDGTLVDSERDGHRVAFNAAFAWAGMPDRWDPTTYGDLLAVAGGRRRLEVWLTAQGHPTEEARELAEWLHVHKTRVFCDLVAQGQIPARPGAAELVASLAARGVGLHVATTGSRAWVEPLLQRHFGLATFASIVTGTEVHRLKPDPAVYRRILLRSHLDSAETVAVEDSSNGLRAALAAGLPCVVVTNDYTRDQGFDGAALVGTGLDDGTVVEWFARWTG